MGSKVKDIGLNVGRTGVIKNLGLSLRLPGFHERAVQGIPEFQSREPEAYRNHLREMECLKARARAEVQRVQLNR